MSTSFKPTQVQLAAQDKAARSTADSADIRVMKTLEERVSQVQEYHFQKIEKPGDGQYSVIKERYGALAATDTDRHSHGHRNERFKLSPMMRERLAIEEEERRVIEDRVKAQLNLEREELMRSAYEKAHVEGLELGRKEAIEAFAKEAQSQIDRLKSAATHLENLRSEIFQANEKYLLDLICRISKMITLRELKTDKDFLLRLTKMLVERVGVRDNIRIRLAQGDLELAQSIREELNSYFGSLKNLQIDGSPQVESGGCWLETGWNTIDASIETQINGVYEALLGEVPPKVESPAEASAQTRDGTSEK